MVQLNSTEIYYEIKRF